MKKLIICLAKEFVLFICTIIQYILGTRFSVGLNRVDLGSCEDNKHSKFKVMHLSDIHYDYFLSTTNRPTYYLFEYHRVTHSQLNSVIRQVKQEKPHVVVITGDLVQWEPESIILFRERFLVPLLLECEIPNGVFVTYGNHDLKFSNSKQLIFDTLTKDLNGVYFLENVDRTKVTDDLYSCVKRAIVHGDRVIEFIGFPDYHDVTFHEQYKHIESKFNTQLPDNVIRIILSHNPDTARFALRDNWDFHLILCGHTHGGQLCFPVPFLRKAVEKWVYNYPALEEFQYETRILNTSCIMPLHPILIKLYDLLPLPDHTRRKLRQMKPMQKLLCILKYWSWGKGLVQFRLKNRSDPGTKRFLYTSSGIATHPPFRLFCAPEISLITV